MNKNLSVNDKCKSNNNYSTSLIYLFIIIKSTKN